MNIDDFEVKIKKYDKIRSVVTSNVIVCNLLEIRGYITRYAELKNPPYTPRWIVSPPQIKIKGKSNKYFWIVQILDPELWHELQQKIEIAVVDYTNLK